MGAAPGDGAHPRLALPLAAFPGRGGCPGPLAHGCGFFPGGAFRISHGVRQVARPQQLRALHGTHGTLFMLLSYSRRCAPSPCLLVLDKALEELYPQIRHKLDVALQVGAGVRVGWNEGRVGGREALGLRCSTSRGRTGRCKGKGVEVAWKYAWLENGCGWRRYAQTCHHGSRGSRAPILTSPGLPVFLCAPRPGTRRTARPWRCWRPGTACGARPSGTPSWPR